MEARGLDEYKDIYKTAESTSNPLNDAWESMKSERRRREIEKGLDEYKGLYKTQDRSPPRQKSRFRSPARLSRSNRSPTRSSSRRSRSPEKREKRFRSPARLSRSSDQDLYRTEDPPQRESRRFRSPARLSRSFRSERSPPRRRISPFASSRSPPRRQISPFASSRSPPRRQISPFACSRVSPFKSSRSPRRYSRSPQRFESQFPLPESSRSPRRYSRSPQRFESQFPLPASPQGYNPYIGSPPRPVPESSFSYRETSSFAPESSFPYRETSPYRLENRQSYNPYIGSPPRPETQFPYEENLPQRYSKSPPRSYESPPRSQISTQNQPESLSSIFDRLDERDKVLLRQAATKKSEDPKLPFGNYLLVFWDGLIHNDSGQLMQLGAFIPNTKSPYVQTIKQEDMKMFHKKKLKCAGISKNRLSFTKNFKGVIHPTKNLVWPLKPLKQSLESFLDFLDKGINSQRPSLDSAILICQYEKDIPYLFRAMRQCGLETRFNSVVKGLGDLKSFINEFHPKYLYYMEVKSTGNDNWSDFVSMRLAEITERLLGVSPNFANFYIKSAFPLNSAKIKKLASYRSKSEQVKFFAPLAQYLTNQLTRNGYQIVLEGIYECSASSNSSVQKVASNLMCTLLVEEELSFEKLHDTYNDKGLSALEMALRTAFLPKMVGQSDKIVEQNLIIFYFFTIYSAILSNLNAF